MDVVAAIEGPSPIFQCAQILQHGPGGDADVDYRVTCVVSQAMGQADLAWRNVLAGRTLADVRDEVEQSHPETPSATRRWLDRTTS